MNEKERLVLNEAKNVLSLYVLNQINSIDIELINGLVMLTEKLQKENERKTEKIENRKNELAILNEKQKDFNKLKNTAKSWEGQYRRTLKENKNLKATNKDLQKSVDMIYADYQDIGNKAFEYSDKIEQLQKENIDLKAKLEYKEYGDLDNIEFEKYINDIVETRTKELKEQLEEEQELNKIIKETRINKILENNIEVKKLREENEKLKADNLEYQRIQDLSDKRTYRKKYLEERRKEEPNLLYPDSDEIYQRYYELKEQLANSIPISKLKEEVLNLMKEAHDKAIKGFISTDVPECGKYSAMAQELGYFIGKIEELLEGSNK